MQQNRKEKLLSFLTDCINDKSVSVSIDSKDEKKVFKKPKKPSFDGSELPSDIDLALIKAKVEYFEKRLIYLKQLTSKLEQEMSKFKKEIMLKFEQLTSELQKQTKTKYIE